MLAAFQILCFSTVIISTLSTYINPIRDFFRPLDLLPTSTMVPSALATPTFVSVPPEPFQTELPANEPAACVIVWVEHPVNNLGGKNRSMVWEELVEAQVAGSGMSARQFFDQVVEYNPVLATDGYVFIQGKTYLLPQCK